MNDPLQDMFSSGALPSTAFAPTSRYYGIATAQIVDRSGRTVSYLLRRFIPPPENFTLRLVHFVQQGERIDNIAARYLGDPEQYWRLCDGNGATVPNALTDTVGASIRVTLPEGFSAAT